MSKRPSRAADVTPLRPGPGRTPPPPSAPPRRDTSPPEPVDPAHHEAVEEGLEQARRGDYAEESDVEALYRDAGA